jgi:type I restriction enzyme S subunit
LAIARFLDWANSRLERAIRAKRKVIALLNEQKQAIIHRTVTRGLDPAATLKPSGIPWLGDIPAHWEVRPIKQVLSRMDYGTSENVRTDGRIRVLTMGHIRDGNIVLPTKGGLAAVPSGLLLEKNDLLFNRTNSPELVGKVGLFIGEAQDEVTFASYLVRLRTRSDHNPVWLNYLLNSSAFWSYARSQALVSLHQANLNPKRYGQLLIPIPSRRAEQGEIVEHLRSKAGAIERAVTRLEREIELLREYRTRLVANVVTGKLDVREMATPLPNEAASEIADDDADLSIDPEAIEEETAV